MTTSTNITYETVIGLEVHLQLATKTKIFCNCANEFGGNPNSRTCPVCLGLPGSLPVVNRKTVEYAIKIGLALNCKINTFIKFDRKNYYYPDCPKNYQISQFDFPITHHGHLDIALEDGSMKKITIERGHLEEDAGKLIHDDANNCSLVDFNRTGTPLLEIVTGPDMRSPQEAYDYLQTLKLNLQYLDVSDCDMEKGSLRCDANVSIRKMGDTKLGTKTELKNMNSFKAVKAGLEFEVNRQRQLLEAGERIIQETRLWDEAKAVTVLMRTKEEAHDYRYFPEPDLVPFTLQESVIEDVRKTLPELPAAKLKRFISEYKLSEYDAGVLIQDKMAANYFEECVKHFADTKKIVNWVNGPLLKELKSRKASIAEINLKPASLTKLIERVEDGTISNLVGKDVLTLMIDSGKSAAGIIEEKGLAQVSDQGFLEEVVDELIKEHDNIVTQIKEGKDSAIGFLVGQAMKKTQGKANPKKISELIRGRILNA